MGDSIYALRSPCIFLPAAIRNLFRCGICQGSGGLGNQMTSFIDSLSHHLQTLPTLAKFAFAMALIVGVPPLARRVRLPAVVGFLFAGVLTGPHVLGLFKEHAPIADFCAEIGKLLLMFCAGLEINLALFNKARHRTALFGLITTTVPFLLGTGVGFLFGYRPLTAIVLGS